MSSSSHSVPVLDQTHSDEARDDAAEPVEGEHDARADQHSERRRRWTRFATFIVLPLTALLVAGGVGYLKWKQSSLQAAGQAVDQALPVATDSVAAMLSYKPDSVAKDLNGARDRLTGSFLDDYTKLINDVVIPGATQKKITAMATVAAAAPISSTSDRVVVLLYIDQTTIVDGSQPTFSASTARATLVKVADRWLISNFEPI